MTIAIFGLGYVGTVTAACLGAAGHRILGVDPHPAKVAALARGESPVHEPGVNDRLAAAAAAGLLTASDDSPSALASAEVAIVSVGTPPAPHGGPDLSHVEAVFRDIAAPARSGSCRCRTVVLRSTVPPGTTRHVARHLVGTGIEVLFVPEFLREGNAVADFFEPTLTVAGTADGLPSLLDTAALFPGPVEHASYETAELLKYACNSFHALKVAFANDIGRVARAAGVDGRRVMELLCRDTRLNISPRYLMPGNPYGGSCLPKDVGGLLHLLPSLGVEAPLLEALPRDNETHFRHLLRLVTATGLRRAVFLGVAFKQDTDDLRGSPMLRLASALLADGWEVRLFDPAIDPGRLIGANAMVVAELMPDLANRLERSPEAALTSAPAVVVVSQRCLEPGRLASLLTPEHVVVDVNGWTALNRMPCRYLGVGW